MILGSFNSQEKAAGEGFHGLIQECFGSYFRISVGQLS